MTTKNQFISELSKLRPSSTFLSVMGYRNEHSEIANYSLLFHMNYKNALKRSIIELDSIVPSDDLMAQAKEELINSFNTSLIKMETTSVEEIDDGYTRFFDESNRYIKGVKMHSATGTLHLYGLVVHKQVIMPGVYAVKNKRPLTIAKDKLRRLTSAGKFRQFKMLPDQVDYITVEKMSLLPPQ